MSKRIFLVMVLLICLFSFGVFAEEPDSIRYLDYDGFYTGKLSGVGVEQIPGGYQLKVIQYGEPESAETVYTSADRIFQPQLTSGNSGRFISYLKEVNGEFRLYLLKNIQGQWITANSGKSLNTQLTAIEQMDLLTTDQFVYLAYLQDAQLYLLRYDPTGDQLTQLYQQSVGQSGIDHLTLVEQGQSLVMAYLEQVKSQTNLHIARVGQDGTASKFHSVQQVNGYDLKLLDGQLILAYEVREVQDSKVYLFKSNQDQFHQIAQFAKEDQTPFGVKLLTATGELQVLYREKGLHHKFDLLLTRYSKGQLTPAEYLVWDHADQLLTNLQANIQELNSSTLLLTSGKWDWGSSNHQSYQLIDLDQTLPNSTWKLGKNQTNTNPITITPPHLTYVHNVNLINPLGMVTDAAGNFYALDAGGQVRKFDSTGQLLDKWLLPDGQDTNLTDLVIDCEGYFYLVDAQNHRILRLNPEGQVVEQWGTFGTEVGQFNHPVAIAIDSKNYIYVVDQGNQRIQKFDPQFNFVTQWGGLGAKSGLFNQPTGIAIDTDDQIYIADTLNHRVQVFQADGTYLNSKGTWGMDAGQMIEPVDLAIYNDKLYVADLGNDRIQVLNLYLNYLYELGSRGSDWGQFRHLNSLYVDQHGNIFVSDRTNHTIQKVTPDHTVALALHGGEEISAIQVLEQVGAVQNTRYYWSVQEQRLLQYNDRLIFIDDVSLKDQATAIYTGFTADADYLYFTDSLNHRVVIYDHQGELVKTIGEYGQGVGQFNSPRGIAVDDQGAIYVADTGNHRIQKFDQQGQWLLTWGGLGLEQGQFIDPVSITYQDEQLLVADLGLQRIQSFSKVGVALSAWKGFGDGAHQIPVEEYLKNDLQDGSANQLFASYNYGISHDDTPRRSKNWSWNDRWGYSYRYLISANAYDNPGGDFRNIDRAGISGVTGKYYLHIQAKGWFTRYDVGHFYAILDNEGPTVTMPASSSTPNQAVNLSWVGSDRHTSDADITYKYYITDRHPNQWSTTDTSIWNNRSFGTTTQTIINEGNGTKYLVVQARDPLGNYSNLYTSNFVLDNQAPVISSYDFDVTPDQKLQVTFTGTDNLSPTSDLKYRALVDENPETILEGEFVPEGVVTRDYLLGTVYLHVQVQDRAGNTSAIAHYPIDLVDMTPPSITGLSTVLGAVQSWTWHWDGIDNSATPEQIEYRYLVDTVEHDSLAEVPYGTEREVTVNQSDGVYYLSIQARDHLGNESQVEHYAVTIDNTGPELDLSQVVWTGSLVPNTENLYNSSVSIEIPAEACSDVHGISTVSYQINNGEWMEYVPPITLGVDGAHTIGIQLIDSAGNSNVFDLGMVKIDTTPPELIQPEQGSFEGVWFNSPQNVLISAADTFSGLASLEYKLNQSSWTLLSNGDTVNVTAEQVNQLQVRMVDQAQNVATVSLDIQIDQTVPTITNITSTTHPSTSWTYQRAGDFVVSTGTELSGVSKYYYKVNSDPTYDPVRWGDYQESTSSTIHLTNLPEGIQYLHVHAVDAAGNVGPVAHYQMLVVDENPAQPMIQSDTHTEGASSLYQRGHFFWNTPVAGTKGVVGITHYEYTLEKVTGTQVELVDEGITTLNEVSFAELPVVSIASGAYYRFGLVAVNGAGRKSTKDTFTFNIEDIQQAEIICIFSPTHPNINKYYNNPNAYYSWFDPGATANTEYAYKFGTAGEFSNAVWTPVTEKSVSLPIVNATSGVYKFQVQSSNGTETQTSYEQNIKLDLEVPEITNFEIVLDAVLNQATVNWGSAFDTGGAGLADLRLRLYAEDTSGNLIVDRGWMRAGLSSSQKVIQHLQSGLDYILEFDVRDAAGNRVSRVAQLNLQTGVTYLNGQDINLNLDNWVVEGMSYDGVVDDAEVIISPSYQFHILDEENNYVPVERIPLTSGTVTGGFEGFNETLEYKVSISGHTFYGKGVYINTNGLYLNKIWIATPESFWTNEMGQDVPENQELTFTDVQLNGLVNNQVEGIYEDVKADCSYFNNWFYDIDKFVLKPGSLSFTGQVDLGSAYVNTPLSLNQISLTPEFTFGTIALPSDYQLYIPGGSIIDVLESELSANALLIKEAEFTISIDGQEITTRLGNFTIDYYGVITHLAEYYSEELVFVYGGVTYTVVEGQLGFEGNTLTILEGTGTVPGSSEELPIAAVPLDNQGDVLIPAEKYFTSIQKEVLGFTITGRHGTQIGDYIVFEQGTIDLPIVDGFGEPVSLELRDLPYGANGFELSQVTIYTPFFNYNQLGTLEVTSLWFNSTGLTVNGKMQLGSRLPLGLRYRTLDLQQFTITAADGITTDLVATIPATDPLTIYDALEFSTTQITFRDEPDVKSIYFNSGTMKFIGAVGARLTDVSEVAVNFVEIDHQGDLRQFDTALSTQPFDLRGVNVTAYALDYDPDYIHFTGKVSIPNLSDLEMPIYSLSLNHETGLIKEFYISGDEPLAYDFFSWDMEIYSIQIMEEAFNVKAALAIPDVLHELLPGISGRFMEIDELTISNSGTIEKLDLMVPYRDEIPIAGGMKLIVKDPGVLIENAPMSNFNFGLSFAQAGIILPEELGGGVLTVNGLSFDSSGNIDFDQIQLQNQRIPFYDVATILISDAIFDSEQLSIEGSVTFGDAFPGSFAGRTFDIENLVITGDGIQSFSVATDVTKPLNLFDAVQITPGRISISEREIALANGEVKFIGELAARTTSTPVQLTSFRYDYKDGKITEFNAGFSDINFELFGADVQIASLVFYTDYVSFAGQVILPSQLPGALSSLPVAIETLEINYTGSVRDYRVVNGEPINFDLNGMDLTFNEIAIDSTGFSMDATATLPTSSAIPATLRGTPVSIRNFKINHQFQILDFSVSIDKTATFAMGQVDFHIETLTFTKTKFGMGGKVVLPDSYPGTLGGQEIRFNRFEMNYSGRILYSDISVAKLDFSLGSFLGASIYDLAFVVHNGDLTIGADKVVTSLGSLGKSITFTDVNIGMDGSFDARVSVNVSVPIAGATINIVDPKLEDGGIYATSASLKLPSKLGGKGLNVNDVYIHPDKGLTIGGGTFTVRFPDIKIGDVGFKDTYMTLSKVGSEYFFEGSGSAQVPGVGQFDAVVKLRSISTDYPRGIERIYLSFQSSGLGLPVGTTGLYINGVRGEFADGPIPAGSPYVMQRLGKGMRFSLGVYIRDMTGGLRGTTDFWVNISNGNTAVVGEVSILNKLVSARIAASITDHFRDFYAEANIVITPVEGNAGFRIWSANSQTNLAGWGEVRVSVSRGKVYYKSWRIWRKKFVIAIPSRTWKSPYVGVEFGKFKNGAKGVKGYMSVPLFGKIGFYAGNKGFKLGSLKEYVLIGRPTALFKPLYYDPTSMNLISALQDQELGNYYVGDTEYVGFTLPGHKKQTLDRNYIMSAEPAALEEYYVASTQRLVFVVGYDLGDPDLVAIGPDGRRYTQDAPGVEYVKEENQVMISIPNPDPGNWYLEMEEIRGINYEVAIIGSIPEPELIIEKPTLNAENKVMVSGRGGVFTGGQSYVDLYYDADGENADGVLIAEGVPITDHSFSVEWDTSSLPTGEYYVYGKLYDDGDMPPIITYSDQPYSVVNYQPIMPPTQMQAVLTEDGIQVSWQGDQNPNVAGYTIYYGNTSGDYFSSLNVGYLMGGRIPTVEGDNCYISVVAYNAEGEESSYSEEIIVSQVPEEITTFNLADVELPAEIRLYIGEGQVIDLPYTVNGLPGYNDGDYFTVEFVGLPKGVSASVNQRFYNLYADPDAQKITMSLLSESEDIPVPGEPEVVMLAAADPGETVTKMIFTSVGNPELKVEKELNLLLEYYQPELREVTPAEGINNQAREIMLAGDHFREGVQVFLGEMALNLTAQSKHEVVAVVGQGVGPGVYDLKVVNDDGKFDILEDAYTVLRPEFTLDQLQLQGPVVVPMGAESEVYLKVEGMNEFAGLVTVQPGLVPEGIWVDYTPQTVAPGNEAAFMIGAGYELLPGDYQMTFTGTSGDQIKTAEVTVRVVDEEIVPTIQGFAKPFGVTTEPMRLYGMGFGLSGNLYLNDQLVTVLEWRTNRIDFVIPENATTGMVVVEAGGQRSEPVELIVKEKKYSVTMQPKQVTINHGHTADLRFVVTGFSDPIDFTIDNVPTGMSVQFLNRTTDVVPNYTLEMTLSTEKGMALGEYQLELVGQVGEQTKRIPFTVVVADLPQLKNGEFAEGRVGVSYRDWIDVKGGVAPYQYQILNNSLPAGLKLSTDGVISGVPQEVGSFNITVKVIDQMNQVDERDLRMNILPNEWIYPEYDVMGSNRTLTNGPAAADTEFEQGIKGQPELMLSGEDVIILLEDQVANIYDKATGELTSNFATNNSIVDAVVVKDGVLILDEVGNLSKYRFGNENVENGGSKDGTGDTTKPEPGEPIDPDPVPILPSTQSLISVETMQASAPKDSLQPVKPGDESTVVLSEGDLYLYRDRVIVIRDQLLEIRLKQNLVFDQLIDLAHSYNNAVKGVLKGEVLYYLTGEQQVVGFDLEEQQIVVNANFASTVTDLIGVANGVLAVQQNGEVAVLHADSSTELLLSSGKAIQELIPYAAGYVVGDGNGISLYGFHGKPELELNVDYQKLLVAGNRVYLVNPEAIQAYKLSNLNQVWSHKASNGQNLVVSQEELYAVTDTTLYKFNAPTNVHAPVTTLQTTPKAVDGNNGYYRQDVTVELYSSDLDNEVKVTYYSVDGGEFETYEAGFLLSEGNHFVQYYAMDEELKFEDVQEEWVKIDYTPPTLTLLPDPIDGQNGYYTTPVVNVAILAADVVSGVEQVYYQIDDGVEQLYTGPFTVEGDGSHVVTYYGRDLAGNETQVMSHEILIDSTVPTVEASIEEIDGQNGYYVHVPVEMTLSGADNFSGVDTIYYQIDGQGYEIYENGIYVHGDGDHLVQYYLVDRAGNTSDVAGYQLQIDTTVPEMSLTADPVDGKNGYYIQDPVHVWLTVTDNFAGVEQVYYRIDGGEYLTYVAVEGIVVSGEADHLVEYYAVDLAGNTTPVMEYEVKIDHTVPELTLTADEIDGWNGYYIQDPVQVWLATTDNLSGVDQVYYRIDGGEYLTYVDVAGIVVSGEAVHLIEYYAVDRAGNTTPVMEHVVKIDHTYPAVTLTADEIDGKNGYYIQDPVQVWLAAIDNLAGVDQLYYRIDGGEYLTYVDADGIVVSGEADHLVEYYAVDLAGNTTPVMEHEVKIDHTAPELTLTADGIDGLNGYYIKDPVNIWLAATDNLSGVHALYYRIDGSEYQLYEDGIVVHEEGVHLVEYYGLDVAGNQTEVLGHEVKIDHTVPELTFTPAEIDGKNGYYVTVPVEHLLTGTDNVSGVDTLYYQIDDGAYQIYVDGIRVSGDGPHVVNYYGVDRAGNETQVFSHSLQVDTTPPVTSVTRIKPLMEGLIAQIRLAVTDNYSGFATIHYQIDGGEMATTQQDIYLTTPGEHVVTYYSEDVAGNLEATAEVHYYVKSLDEIDLVENVDLTEFKNALTQIQPFEIDRKVEIGDLIYLDESYTFEMLPDYLQGARLIRTNRHANKTGGHEYYLTFETTVPVRVYVVVENTVTQIPGFTYLGQTKFATRKHFSQNQNVFVQEVSGTETIRIPGSQLLDVGHAPLVFVDFNGDLTQPYMDIELMTPVKENGIWYLDLAGYGYDREDYILEGTDLNWSYRLGGEEIALGTGNTARLAVPFREQAYLLEVCLTATNSRGVTGIANKSLLIVDQSGVYILQPQDQDKYLPGETIILAGEMRDEMGGLMSSPLNWQIRRADRNWVSIGAGNLLEYTLPAEQGAYYVRAYVGEDEMMVKFEVTQTNKKPGQGDQGDDGGNNGKGNGKKK